MNTADSYCYIIEIGSTFQRSHTKSYILNVQKRSSTTNFSIYALEDCTTYEGAFIEDDFTTNAIKLKYSSQCQNEAEDTGIPFVPADNVNANLFSTKCKLRRWLISSIIKIRILVSVPDVWA